MTDFETLQGPPSAGDEAETLIGALERNRRTFRWKAGGLDAAGLNTTAAASTITLGGLLKHLALLESFYFAMHLRGAPIGEPWNQVDWENEAEGWEWRSAADDDPEYLYALWDESVTRARHHIAEALSNGGLAQPTNLVRDDGVPASMRRLIIDMVEEYARHTGHADLIRESIDGLVGEDAPV
jgi:hypothetical protein